MASRANALYAFQQLSKISRASRLSKASTTSPSTSTSSPSKFSTFTTSKACSALGAPATSMTLRSSPSSIRLIATSSTSRAFSTSRACSTSTTSTTSKTSTTSTSTASTPLEPSRASISKPPDTHSTSVNPSEVSHFNALASSWWDPYGPSRLLHLMNPLRHEFLSSCIPSPAPATRYLDIGCGGGIFAESAARLTHTAHVTALDPSAAVLAVAQEHARQDPLLLEPGRLHYLNAAIEDLPLPASRQEQYDVLTLFEVVEHVARPEPFLRACLPFVRPGGWLVISTIARTWTSWLTTKLVAEDLLRVVPRGTHEWAQYINADELERFFEQQHAWMAPGSIKLMGCVYVPGLGWKMVPGGEKVGNYFFAVQRDERCSV